MFFLSAFLDISVPFLFRNESNRQLQEPFLVSERLLSIDREMSMLWRQCHEKNDCFIPNFICCIVECGGNGRCPR